MGQDINKISHLRDFVRGSLIGGAAGDALGYAVEFDRYSEIIAKYSQPGIKETTYAKIGSKWEKYDEYWQYDYYKEGDELWKIVDFEIKDELTEFPKSLIMEVQNREVKPNDVLDYLDSLDY